MAVIAIDPKSQSVTLGARQRKYIKDGLNDDFFAATIDYLINTDLVLSDALYIAVVTEDVDKDGTLVIRRSADPDAPADEFVDIPDGSTTIKLNPGGISVTDIQVNTFIADRLLISVQPGAGAGTGKVKKLIIVGKTGK
ncbi:hypothetical protein JYU20_00485 [Bacteroidales bacterium AH-315-I05]|nr:hypothetical protein [Bacteroidales bacterium AH-315-I05]